MIPPPLYLNLALTYACNLRCKICPSQKGLGDTARTHIPLHRLQNIIDILFPVVGEVALNSWGEPLTYPYFDDVVRAINRYKCRLFLQTNATLLTEKNIKLLADSYGTISLSIDAVGSLFEKLRVNGLWDVVDREVRRLNSARCQKKLTLQVSATVSLSNLECLDDLVVWSHDVGIDLINFRPYQPFVGGTERAVAAVDIKKVLAESVRWLEQVNSRLRLNFNDINLYAGKLPVKSCAEIDKVKPGLKNFLYPVLPEGNLSHPDYLCTAPIMGLDIGVDGQMSTCCRSQCSHMSFLEDIESFADHWFGENMSKLRESLKHNSSRPLVLPNCQECIKKETGLSLASLDYTRGSSYDPEGIVFTQKRVSLAAVQHLEGEMFGGRLPIGMQRDMYDFYEDDVLLPAINTDRETIQQKGGGRWLYLESAENFEGNIVWFSSTDHSDPITNGRKYQFLKK